jgi:hypothetical protein
MTPSSIKNPIAPPTPPAATARNTGGPAAPISLEPRRERETAEEQGDHNAEIDEAIGPTRSTPSRSALTTASTGGGSRCEGHHGRKKAGLRPGSSAA